MRELKVTREEAFSQALDLLHERCKRCIKADGPILSDGIKKHFLAFLCAGFMGSVWELNCHTV
jgi:hypothetical protein